LFDNSTIVLKVNGENFGSLPFAYTDYTRSIKKRVISMLPPDTSANENIRIKTLQSLNVLDTPAEERLDRITQIAANMFDVPIALVSLVDSERQWFKSCIGLEVSETARDISFCGHAILSDKAFVVNNTLDDSRFADNPLVTGEPFIRFYAGIPLAHENGERLGTLCIIDTKPRDFSTDDIALLRELAVLVELELVHKINYTMDEVTGLSNKAGFKLLAPVSLKVCQKLNLKVSVVYLFMKGLLSIQHDTEKYNDFLRSAAKVFKTNFRATDLIAHYDENGFVALVSNANKANTQVKIDSLVKQLNQLSYAKGNDLQVEFITGVIDSSPFCDIDELIFNAFLKLHEQPS